MRTDPLYSSQTCASLRIFRFESNKDTISRIQTSEQGEHREDHQKETLQWVNPKFMGVVLSQREEEGEHRSLCIRQEQQLQRPHGKERAVTVPQRDAALPGGNWQQGGRNTVFKQVSVGFLHTSKVWVVRGVHTLLCLNLHIFQTLRIKVTVQKWRHHFPNMIQIWIW